MSAKTFVDEVVNRLVELFRPYLQVQPRVQPIIDANFPKVFTLVGNGTVAASTTSSLTLKPPKYKKWRILSLAVFYTIAGGVSDVSILKKDDSVTFDSLFSIAGMASKSIMIGRAAGSGGSASYDYYVETQPTLINSCYLVISGTCGAGVTNDIVARAVIEETLNLEEVP